MMVEFSHLRLLIFLSIDIYLSHIFMLDFKSSNFSLFLESEISIISSPWYENMARERLGPSCSPSLWNPPEYRPVWVLGFESFLACLLLQVLLQEVIVKSEFCFVGRAAYYQTTHASLKNWSLNFSSLSEHED